MVVKTEIAALVDTDRYPLDRPDDRLWQRLLERGRREIAAAGSLSLDRFVRPAAVRRAVAEVEAHLPGGAYRHEVHHNIYFSDDLGADGEAARARSQRTSSLTLAGDLLRGGVLDRVYRWQGLARFLAALFGKPALSPMADPLACLNVMSYSPADGLGWHFDRAEFTVTLLLRAAGAGGVFQYRRNLRSADDPNHAGVVRLLHGEDAHVAVLHLAPGTLNVFVGLRSPHRVTPVTALPSRLIAVLSFMERPDVTFPAVDRRRFYGRAEVLRGNG